MFPVTWWWCALTKAVSQLLTTLDTVVVMMMCHRDILLDAQNDIDTLLKMERLPSWEDSKDLPIIDAIIMEALRCANTETSYHYLICTALQSCATCTVW